MKNTKEQVDKWWLEYSKNKDEDIRNKLIEHYFPFVQKIANKLAEKLNYRVAAEELASAGIDGLYKAINKFSLGRGVKFESYSQARVKGSMIDHLRKEDIIPRSVRMNYNKFEKTRQELQNEKHRKCIDDEVAMSLGVSEEFSKNKKKFHPISFCSLDNVSANGSNDDNIKQDINFNLIDHDAKSPGGKLGRVEFFNKLMSKNFSLLEKNIVYLYYYKELTMDKVAEKVDLSESRVSQMIKKILKRMRDKIERNPEFFGEDIMRYIGETNHKGLIF